MAKKSKLIKASTIGKYALVIFLFSFAIASAQTGKTIDQPNVLGVEDTVGQPIQEDVKPGNVNLRYEAGEDGPELKDVNDEGDSKEATHTEKKQVEKLMKEQEINLATEDGSLQIEHKGVKASTNFPLSIDPNTKELIVTTPAGQKAVTVLPDQAVQNATRAGHITFSPIPVATSVATPVQLSSQDGQVVYKVEGQKHVRLFGIIPLNLPTTAIVSSSNGTVTTQQSILTRLLDLLSR